MLKEVEDTCMIYVLISHIYAVMYSEIRSLHLTHPLPTSRWAATVQHLGSRSRSVHLVETGSY